MSGGIAYVLDEDGTFAERCNTQLVGLEALDADDERIVLDAARRARRAHRLAGRRTRLLADWNPRAFVKVIPHDYKRALAELGDEVRYQDHPVSAGGVGFVTKESEEAA